MTQPEASPPTSDPKSVFVISPIGTAGTDAHTHALKTLNFLIRKALVEPEWKVIRADFEDAPDSITQLAIRRIIEADLVVANLTGHNPNVFYELAVAHSFKKPVVMVTAVGSRLPFDITDQRCIFYDLTDPESVDDAKSALLKSARYALESPNDLKTPLSEYARIAEISARASTGDNAAVSDLIGQILERLDGIEGSVRQVRVNDLTRRVHGDAARLVGIGEEAVNGQFASQARLLRSIELQPVATSVEQYNSLRERPSDELTLGEQMRLAILSKVLHANPGFVRADD